MFPPVLLVTILVLDRWVLVVPEIVVRALETFAIDGVGVGLVQAEAADIPVGWIGGRCGAGGSRRDRLRRRGAGSLGVGGVSVGHAHSGARWAASDLAQVVFGNLVALIEKRLAARIVGRNGVECVLVTVGMRIDCGEHTFYFVRVKAVLEQVIIDSGSLQAVRGPRRTGA